MIEFTLRVEDPQVLEKIRALGFPEKELLSFLRDWALEGALQSSPPQAPFFQQFLDNLDKILPILQQKLMIQPQASPDAPDVLLKEDPTVDLTALLGMFDEE